MRKHATGLVFFVLIVAVFAFGYSVFRNYPLPEMEPVVEQDRDPTLRDPSPDAKGRYVRVTQAIADPLAKTLSFSLSNVWSDVSEVEFAFYIVNVEGVRFVRDEVVNIRLEQWPEGTASGVIKYKTDWLGSKQVTDNLYVVAIPRSSIRKPYALAPFSRENATPVLIAKN